MCPGLWQRETVKMVPTGKKKNKKNKGWCLLARTRQKNMKMAPKMSFSKLMVC